MNGSPARFLLALSLASLSAWAAGLLALSLLAYEGEPLGEAVSYLLMLIAVAALTFLFGTISHFLLATAGAKGWPAYAIAGMSLGVLSAMWLGSGGYVYDPPQSFADHASSLLLAAIFAGLPASAAASTFWAVFRPDRERTKPAATKA